MKSQIKNSTGNKFRFIGYSGAPVDLSDHGFDAPVFYDLKTGKMNNSVDVNWNHRNPLGKTLKTSVGRDVRGEGVIEVKNKTTKHIMNSPNEHELSMEVDASDSTVKFFPNGTTVNNHTTDDPCYVLYGWECDGMAITREGRDGATGMKIFNSKMTAIELKKIKNAVVIDDNWNLDGALDDDDGFFDEHINNGDDNADDDSADFEDTFFEDNTLINNSAPQRVQHGRSMPTGSLIKFANANPECADTIYTAMDEGWAPDRIKNQIRLDKLHNKLPEGVTVSRSAKENEREIEARLANVLGKHAKKYEEPMRKKYGEKMYEKIDNMAPMGITEFCVLSGRQMGIHGYTGFGDRDSLIQHVGHVNKNRAPVNINNASAGSTFDMPNLFLRTTEFLVEAAWKVRKTDFAATHCHENFHKDFRPSERIRPVGGKIWEGLDPDGRIKSASFGDEVQYTAELDTKAQLINFNRKWIQNDDFGIIAELLNLMMEGAFILPDYKLVQHMLQPNGTFFQAGINDIAGATAALSEPNMQGIHDTLDLTIEKGRVNWEQDLDDEWRAIVSSRALERQAFEVFGQDHLIGPTGIRQGQKNFWYQAHQVERFRQLTNQSMNANGLPDMWFLWPGSTEMAPFSIDYLAGQRTPVMRVADAPIDQLGFSAVGYFDVEINDREPTAIRRLRPTGTIV